ncbi:hypothetical protein FRC01_014459 [Tulasnella sp. 417]|nr:hypothetical protein FRC01_014459 [Tulasnella sp. 417]
MSRSHFEKVSAHAGAIITLLATVISFLVTISVPSIRAFDLVRISFRGFPSLDLSGIQIRLGIWGYCEGSIPSNEWVCVFRGYGYSSPFYSVGAYGNIQAEGGISKEWTRGLVVSASATAFLIITTIAALTKHHLIAALLSWLSGFLTFSFMGVNLALYLKLRPQMRYFDDFERIDLGAGFWMSLAVLILTLVSGFVLVVKHRRELTGVENGASSFSVLRGGFLSRFWQK